MKYAGRQSLLTKCKNAQESKKGSAFRGVLDSSMPSFDGTRISKPERVEPMDRSKASALLKCDNLLARQQ